MNSFEHLEFWITKEIENEIVLKSNHDEGLYHSGSVAAFNRTLSKLKTISTENELIEFLEKEIEQCKPYVNDQIIGKHNIGMIAAYKKVLNDLTKENNK